MSNDKIESFFLKFKECYQKISQRSEPSSLRVKLGNECAELHFSNSFLKKLMSRSLAHLLKQEENHQVALTIYCFEGDLRNLQFTFPWTELDLEVQGLINGFNTERFQTIYQHGVGAIIIFDNLTKEGIYYIDNHQRIPYWEISFPFRTILHLWTRDTPYQLFHAGGIGLASASLILSGKSGSGKSSTSISTLLHPKLLFAGDDYILVDTKNKVLYSLYHCAKIEWDNLARLHFLNGMPDKDFSEAEKAIIFIGELMSDKILLKSNLSFCIAPKIAHSNKTQIIESSPSASFKSLGPTTLFQLPLIREEAFAKCVSLTRELRNYEMLLGTDPQEIADTLYTFLEDNKKQ